MFQHKLRTHSLAAVLLLSSISFLSQSAFCQEKLSMIVAGVHLSLGMKREEVLTKFEDFKLNDLGNDVWMIVRKNPFTDEFEPVGEIQFIQGKLYSASREWGTSQDQSAVKLFGALYAALSTATSKSGTDALIQAYEFVHPDISSKNIVIDVNGRSFTITISEYSQPRLEQVEVHERIAQEH